jgi:hypothetical protein
MLLLLPILHAQASAAPIPSQILNAKKVFIANAGGGFDKEMWSGDPSQAYNDSYGAIKPGDTTKSLELPPRPIWFSRSALPTQSGRLAARSLPGSR